MTTAISIRIDSKLKNKAGKIFSDMGLDMSTGVKIFLSQVIAEEGLPFTPTKNLTAIKARWDKQTAHAIKHGKTYKTGKEVLADLW